MFKGTTPTHTFTINLDTSLIKSVRILYAQDDKIVFCKETSDCVLEGQTISTKLTQEETFKFDHEKFVQIQVRVLTKDDNSLMTPIKCVGVEKCLENEVMI
jgi:hypothetical protein